MGYIGCWEWSWLNRVWNESGMFKLRLEWLQNVQVDKNADARVWNHENTSTCSSRLYFKYSLLLKNGYLVQKVCFLVAEHRLISVWKSKARKCSRGRKTVWTEWKSERNVYSAKRMTKLQGWGQNSSENEQQSKENRIKLELAGRRTRLSK